MKKSSSILATLALVAAAFGFAASARADGGGIGGGFGPFALARATYDCPPGPGYMTFAVIDAYQQRTVHTLWLGSRDICQAQAQKLYAQRSTFTDLTLIGICSGQDEVYYLKRWSIDPYGRHVFQGDTYYGPLADCQAEADRTNSNQ